MRRTALIWLVLWAGACGDTDGDKGEVTEGHGARLDEAQISAELKGSSMTVTVPLQRIDETSSLNGTLTVELLQVGQDTPVDTGKAGFTLPQTGARPTVTLDAPSFSDFSELGGYVLRYTVALPDGSLYGRRSLFMAVQRLGLVVLGNNRFPVDEKGTLRVLVVEPQSGKGVEGALVTLRFTPDSGTPRTLDSGKTDALGELQASFTFKADEKGPGTLEVSAGSRTSSHSILVEQERQILLTTDKPLYQPGQTVHIRALAMGQPALTPSASEKLLIEVEDPQGNKLFKKDTTTDSYGIASLRFTLARLVNLGTYRVRVTTGTTVREKSFRVERYTLPKFKVALTLDRPFYTPGEGISGSVQADYFFEKHVAAGQVTVSAALPGGQPLTEVIGTTDQAGFYAFKLGPAPAGTGAVLISARVTDVAGAVAEASATATVGADVAVLQAVPERTHAAQGEPLTVFVLATDPAGKPLQGTVALDGGLSGSATLDASGLAAVQGSVSFCNGGGLARFTGDDGTQTSATFALQCDYGPVSRLRLGTDRALYASGETAKVTVSAPTGASMAELDVLQGNATVSALPISLVNGKGSVTLKLEGELRRTLTLRAHALVGGSVLSDRKLIYVQGSDQLSVKILTDKTSYRPAESAKVTLQLTDMQGKPSPGALGVQVVDEALYALTEVKPGLERRFFFLEQEVIDAGSALRFVSPDVVLKPQPSAEDQLQARMLFAAIGEEASYPIDYRSPDADVHAAAWASRPGFDALAAKLEEDFKARFNPYWFSRPSPQEMSDWCEHWARTRHDDWGQALRVETTEHAATLKSAGMDETWDTADDLSTTLYYSIVDPKGPGIPLPSAAMDGGAAYDSGAWGWPDAAAAADAGAPPPAGDGGGTKIRQYFPETLYVNPALITDSQGKAEIDLALADSITTWRLSSIAHTKAGQLGSAAAGITVFQEFFVDTLLPTHLLQGDEVEVPVAVYNYLGSAQSVTVTVKPEPWFDLLESASKQVSVPAKSVGSVSFRIRATKVGAHPFTATGVSATDSDGVKRTVEVKPDGERHEVVFSGTLKPGTTTHTVQIPTAAIDDASELFVRVYPGILAEVVQGFEALLQEPHGCFEQTSSTTYPNVMVLQYLKQSGLSTPALAQKAEGYIENGYQRLLTYEVQGGGFSLWGAPPANLILSAFGLMELYDMSKVRYVDESLITRTQSWLLSQQSADGSFPQPTSGYYENAGSMAEDTLRATAYTAWALRHSGFSGAPLDQALAYLKQQIGGIEDTYTLAVAANALAAGAPASPTTTSVLTKLKSKAVDDGKTAYWDASGVSMTYGYGQSMTMETTAMAVGALLLAKDQSGLTQKGLAYLAAHKGSLGSYGTTQATVLALRALIMALSAQGGDKAQGTIQVRHGGVVQGSVSVTPATSDVTRLFDLKQVVVEGDNKVNIDFTGSGELAYQVVGIYYLPHGSTAPAPGPLGFSVSYDRTSLKVNESVQVTATVQNSGSGPIPTVLLRVGLPPGFTVDESALTPQKTGGVVNNVEQDGPYLVLYLGDLATIQSVTFAMTAALAGAFKAPVSTAYPYYSPELGQLVDTPLVTVTP